MIRCIFLSMEVEDKCMFQSVFLHLFFKLFYTKSFLCSQWKGTIIVMEMNPLLTLQYGLLYVQLNV